jgi:N-terminal acetyltransferase B complex non-catalytic subunit
MESTRAAKYFEEYIAGLELGAALPTTELQPADDLIILTGISNVCSWQLTQDEVHLYNAASLLEFATTKSSHSFRMRLLLIRIYRLLGIVLAV